MSMQRPTAPGTRCSGSVKGASVGGASVCDVEAYGSRYAVQWLCKGVSVGGVDVGGTLHFVGGAMCRCNVRSCNAMSCVVGGAM